MNRRKAIQTTAALAVGAGFAPAVAFQAESPKEKLGVALVGLGNYATRQLAPALQETQHCYLAGIVTGTPEKARQWGEQYNIPQQNIYNYETFDRIRNNPDIDIVYIVLPNFMHAEYTIRAFEAGKHVICEKPMGMNAAECRQMIAAQRKAGKKLQVGYRLYYEPHHLAAQEIGKNRQWGKNKLMESSLGFRMANPDSWRLDKDMGGGGAIMDLGVYCIQAARRFAGELPHTVTAQGINTDPSLFKGIFETVFLQLYFPSGAAANASTSYNAYVDRFHAACERGWLELKPSFNAGQPVVINSMPEISASAPVSSFQQTAQMDAFVLNIQNNTQATASGEEGLIDLQIIEAVKRAMDTGGEEKVAY
jgi:predicted dehydrogenase